LKAFTELGDPDCDLRHGFSNLKGLEGIDVWSYYIATMFQEARLK
jgi:hypothetical protein